MCLVQLKYIKRATNLIFVLNEAMDQLVMANSLCWYGHVWRRENGHVLRRELWFEVEGQKKLWKLKMTWESRLRKKASRLV